MALKSVASTTKVEMKRLIESLCGFEVSVVRTLNMEVKKSGILLVRANPAGPTSHCLHGRQRNSWGGFICKVIIHELVLGRTLCNERFVLDGFRRIHSGRRLCIADRAVGPTNGSESSAIVEGGGDGKARAKRKKLKGKRAVVRWLKLLRWKKKKEYHRMTSEEKILHKLRLARKKEERLVEALKKVEPKEASETAHDPEILTPEEHFFFLKMGLKSKNYVPIGRRGIYGGVVLNMHLHWKKHQTLQVVVKTFTPEEVKEVAKELARLSGGIVLDIHEENTIIMYRGKNYSQPPTEIMSPRETLSRKRALDKSKYRDGLRAVRKHIPKLEQELRLLQARAKNEPASVSDLVVEEETQETDLESVDSESYSDELKEKTYKRDQCSENDDDDDGNRVRIGLDSDSEDLSDIFDTDSGIGSEESLQRPLYMEEFDKFPVKSDGEIEDFDDHLRRISVDTKNDVSPSKDARLQNFDEVDRLFLRAATLLKKKSR